MGFDVKIVKIPLHLHMHHMLGAPMLFQNYMWHLFLSPKKYLPKMKDRNYS